ncbi:MAG: hypothetical protein OHK0029_00800 [Armatimonadaceae bacterium]
MKIAVVHNLGAGGAKRALYEQARELVRRGHHLHLYAPVSANEAYLPLSDLEIPTLWFGNRGGGQPPEDTGRATERTESVGRRLFRQVFGNVAFEFVRDSIWTQKQEREVAWQQQTYAEIAHAIQQAKPDLVYVHQCNRVLAPEPLFHGLAGLPTVFYIQDTLRRAFEWSGQHLSAPLTAFRERERQRYVAGVHAAAQQGMVLVNSWFSREGILRTTGVESEVCYLGVDCDYFTPAKEVGRRHEVLSVGALRPEKRHDRILEAVALLPSDRRPTLRIVGYELGGGGAPGPVTRRLQQQAAERGVALCLESDVSDEALRTAYRECGVMVFAPYLEPFGLTPLEAMACETPVVGIPEGGIRETVQNGKTGMLAEPHPAGIAAAIGQLLDAPEDAARLARTARAIVQQEWTWQRSADRLEEVFERARSAGGGKQ